MTQRLDAEEYDDSQTVTIKIPLTVPYATDSREFVRVDGVFEHEGDIYHLVKQRLYSDTLEIVCIKDRESKHMEQALNEYVKTFTDGATSNQASSKAVVEFNFIKDYTIQTFSFDQVSVGWSINILKGNSFPSFISQYCVSIVHPPERA